MVSREKVSDLITTPLFSTLKAKITITKGFFDHFLAKKQKFRTMSTFSPHVHLVGNFPPTRKPILSIVLLDQNFNANDVDIMVFEPSALFPTAAVVWGKFWGLKKCQ